VAVRQALAVQSLRREQREPTAIVIVAAQAVVAAAQRYRLARLGNPAALVVLAEGAVAAVAWGKTPASAVPVAMVGEDTSWW